MNVVDVTGRLILAGTFLFAAVMKLRDRTGTRRMFEALGLSPRASRPLAIGLPLLESGVAAALVPSQTSRVAAVMAFGLLVVFSAVMAMAWARGGAPTCQCFGAARATPVGWRMFTRNGLLAALAVLVIREPRPAAVLVLFANVGHLPAMTYVAGVLGLAILCEAWLILELFRQHGRLMLRVETIEGAAVARRPAVVGKDAASGVRWVPGTPAPSFALRRMNGRPVELAVLWRRQAVMLIYVASSCSACATVLAGVKTWRRELERRVSVVVVVRAGDGQEAQKFFEDVGDVFVHDDLAAEGGDLGVTPAAMLIAKGGTVAAPVAYGALAIEALVAREAASIPRAVRDPSVPAAV